MTGDADPDDLLGAFDRYVENQRRSRVYWRIWGGGVSLSTAGISWTVASLLEDDLPYAPALVLNIAAVVVHALLSFWYSNTPRWERNLEALKDQGLVIALSTVIAIACLLIGR